MERYERTQLLWNWSGILELKTDLPVTDWPHPGESYVHTIASIKALALPDRAGQVTVDFRRVSISPNADARAIICDRLGEALERHRGKSIDLRYIQLKSGRAQFDDFVLLFKLNDGRHFCEAVIPIAKCILDTFHVEDEHQFRLSDFKLTRQTMIKFEDNWITYENWLRIRYRLPVTHA